MSNPDPSLLARVLQMLGQKQQGIPGINGMIQPNPNPAQPIPPHTIGVRG